MAESNYDSQQLSGDEALAKVRSLLKSFRSTMMLTNCEGSVHTRPMGVQGDPAEFMGALWFFTDRDSRKVRELEQDPHMSLIFQSDSDSAYMH